MPYALKYLVIATLFCTPIPAVMAQPTGPIQIEIQYAAPTKAQNKIYFHKLKEVIESRKSKTQAKSAPDSESRASAPPLSYLQVAFVISIPCGNEPIAQFQSTTICDHGGEELTVITDEIGYGDVPLAQINGATLSLSDNILTEPICENAAGDYAECVSGQTVVGFRNHWRLNGYQNGLFTYQNISSNSPWNTMFDSISIQ